MAERPAGGVLDSVGVAPPTATVVVEEASVTYRVYEDRRQGLRELLATRKPRRAHVIEAVKGVSFTASAGEVIGVVGHNGSGKSSLLAALAGLLPVTSGAVYARTQPVLLGVNAALKPQLSGRRNIELGGLALGMTRRQVVDTIDAIIDFTGLRASIDLPIRTYSSGMRARLHFAIATAVDPDILLIDEALAVGDEEFRERSRRRIRELRANAGTVFLVSHNLGEIRDSCTRVLWMDAGRLVADGPPGEVVPAYRASKGPQRRKRRRHKRRRRVAGQAGRRAGGAGPRSKGQDSEHPAQASGAAAG